MDRCTCCVLPRVPAVSFDSSQTCMLCQSTSKLAQIRVAPEEARLHELIDQTRKRAVGKTYDCAVGYSGGRDSTLLLHQLVNVHGLRCIAIFGKNIFTPPEIIENVYRITSKLGVRLVEFEISPDLHRRVSRFAIEKYAKTGLSILANLACAPCKLTNREVFARAKQLDVNTVIYGGNRYEYFTFGPASIDIHHENPNEVSTMALDMALRFAKGAKLLWSVPSLMRYLPTFCRGALMYLDPHTAYLQMRYPDIDRFDYFHFAPWNESELLSALRELGWQLPPGATTTWRADCVFEAVKNTIFRKQLGFTYLDAFYSNLIRAGKMDRQEALDRLSREDVSGQRLRMALEIMDLPGDILN